MIDWSKAPEWAGAVVQASGGSLFWVMQFGGVSPRQRLTNTRPDESEIADMRAEGHKWKLVATRPEGSEWSGEGLPPVGTVCEVQGPQSKGWGRARIQYQEKAVCVWRWLDCLNPDQIDHAERPDRLGFRPLRSERDKAVDEMTRRFALSASFPEAPWRELFAQMHDAGYRKP